MKNKKLIYSESLSSVAMHWPSFPLIEIPISATWHTFIYKGIIVILESNHVINFTSILIIKLQNRLPLLLKNNFILKFVCVNK